MSIARRESQEGEERAVLLARQIRHFTERQPCFETAKQIQLQLRHVRCVKSKASQIRGWSRTALSTSPLLSRERGFPIRTVERVSTLVARRIGIVSAGRWIVGMIVG